MHHSAELSTEFPLGAFKNQLAERSHHFHIDWAVSHSWFSGKQRQTKGEPVEGFPAGNALLRDLLHQTLLHNPNTPAEVIAAKPKGTQHGRKSVKSVAAPPPAKKAKPTEEITESSFTFTQ